MAKLTIKGVPPFDGDYPVEISSFTNRELHLIKQESGVRAGELEEAFNAGDNDLLVAIGMIALQRAGHDPKQTREVLWNADAGSWIAFDFTEEEQAVAEEDAGLPPPIGPWLPPDENEPTPSSGPVSENGGANPESSRSRIGTPA